MLQAGRDFYTTGGDGGCGVLSSSTWGSLFGKGSAGEAEEGRGSVAIGELTGG